MNINLGKKFLGAVSVDHLPEDPPPDPALKMSRIEEGDYRKGLVPGTDLAVSTRSALKKGTVLGLYRNITVTPEEEHKSQKPIPDDYQGNWLEWRRVLEAYIADVLQPPKVYKDTEDIYTDVLQVQQLQHTIAIVPR